MKEQISELIIRAIEPSYRAKLYWHDPGSKPLRQFQFVYHWIQQDRCWSTNDCRYNNRCHSFAKLSRLLHLLHGVTLIAANNLFHIYRLSIVLSQTWLWDWSHIKRSALPAKAGRASQPSWNTLLLLLIKQTYLPAMAFACLNKPSEQQQREFNRPNSNLLHSAINLPKLA